MLKSPHRSNSLLTVPRRLHQCLCMVEDVLKPPTTTPKDLATDRSKAVILVYTCFVLVGVGVSCHILYSIASYSYVRFSELITSVGKERDFLS